MRVSTNPHLIRTSWGQGLVLFSLWLFPQHSPLAPGLSMATCLVDWEDTHEHMSRCPQVSKLPAQPDLLPFPEPLLAYSFGTLRLLL